MFSSHYKFNRSNWTRRNKPRTQKVKSCRVFYTQTYTKLKNAQTQMGYPKFKLIQDVTTRWNSTFEMFHRCIWCIVIKEPLISTIAIIGYVDNLVNEDFEII